MKMTRSLFGIAVAAFLGGTLIAACGEFEDGACITDSDCITGEEVCLASSGQCVEICESDTECFGSDECRPRPGSASDIKVCLPAQSTGNGDEQGCTDHSDCNEAIGEFCDTAIGQCVPDPDHFEGYYTVLIQDRTTDPSRCPDITYGYDTSGVVLTAVVLRDGEGQIVGYGDAVKTEIAGDTDYGHPEDIINGEPPNFEGQCPTEFETVDHLTENTTRHTTFTENNVAALGCGGRVFIQFKNANGDYISFDDSNSIEVRTYGTVCSEDVDGHNPQSTDDPYDIEICTTNNQTNPDVSTCTVLKSDVQGIIVAPVSGD